jgi:transposase-like protein
MKTDLLRNIMDKLNNRGFSDNIVCPDCHNNIIIKNGKSKGKQRFICKTCGKNFNSLTNTPMSKSHKPEKWPLFIDCVIRGLSLRAAAAEIGVSYVTLFYWRHKLMKALKSTEDNSLTGDVEADDIFLAYSDKGSRKISGRKPNKTSGKYYIGQGKKVFLLVAADHSGHLFLEASASRNSYIDLIYDSLDGLVNKSAVFCSNYKTFYAFFAKKKGIKQHFIVTRCTRTEAHNIDLANGYRRKVEIWLDRFQGVASKYLNNYLSLFNCLRKSNFDETEIGIINLFKALKYVNINDNYRSIKELKLA